MDTAGNRNSAQPMGNCTMHPIDSNCFLFWGGWGLAGYLCSQWVHNVFPIIFTIAPHLLPYVLSDIVLLEPILVGKTLRLTHFNVWHASWNTIMILVRKAISPYLGLGFSASFAYFWVRIQLSSQPKLNP
jgi:hypothetical protein